MKISRERAIQRKYPNKPSWWRDNNEKMIEKHIYTSQCHLEMDNSLLFALGTDSETLRKPYKDITI